MSNPIYYLLESYENIRKAIADHFNLIISHKHFKGSNEPYFLLDIPVDKNAMLTFNGNSMRIVSHHFTVPKTQDHKANQYHYTINMVDSESKMYRVHVFYNKLGKINLEPTLFVVNQGESESSISSIKPQDREGLLSFAMNQTNIIMKLKEHQNTLIDLFLKLIRTAEGNLNLLRQQRDVKKEEYIKAAQSHIENMKRLESLANNLYVKDRAFYEYDLKLFCEAPKATVKDTAITKPLVVSNDEQFEGGLIEVNSDQQTAEEKKMSDNQSAILFLETFLSTYAHQPKVPSTLHEHLNKVLEQFMILHVGDNLSMKMQSKFMILKPKLNKVFSDFFESNDMFFHEDLLVQAIALGLTPLTNQMIAQILKLNKVSMLMKLVDRGLITESSVYALGADASKHTILEWCVAFEREACFGALMKAGFSLDYVSEKDSPFISLATNSETYEKFASHLGLNMVLITRLSKRLVLLIQKSMQTLTDSETKELYAAYLQSIPIHTKIFAATSKNIHFRKIMNTAKQECNDKMAKEMEAAVGVEKYAKFLKWRSRKARIVSLNTQFGKLLYDMESESSLKASQSYEKPTESRPDVKYIKLIMEENYIELEEYIVKQMQTLIDNFLLIRQVISFSLDAPLSSKKGARNAPPRFDDLRTPVPLLVYRQAPNTMNLAALALPQAPTVSANEVIQDKAKGRNKKKERG